MSNEPDFNVEAPELGYVGEKPKDKGFGVERPPTKSKRAPLPLHLLFAALMGAFFAFGIKGLAAQSELDTFTTQAIELALENKRLEEELERTQILLRVTETYAEDLAAELELTQGICASIADRIDTIADNIIISN